MHTSQKRDQSQPHGISRPNTYQTSPEVQDRATQHHKLHHGVLCLTPPASSVSSTIERHNQLGQQSILYSSTPLPQANASSPPSSIPHHESLKPGGTLQTRNIPPNSPISAVVNKRLSAVSGEEKRNANRDSQISTASTNTSGISRRRKTHVGPWQLGKTIGKGSSGRVRKARHALTGQDAAIKIVSKTMAQQLRTASLAHMEKLLSAGIMESG